MSGFCLPDLHKLLQFGHAAGSFQALGYDDLRVPSGLLHREKADVAGDAFGHALHVTDDALTFMRLAVEQINAVLDARAADTLELLAEKILMPLLRYQRPETAAKG